MSPELVEEFVSHFDRLRRAGQLTDANGYAFPNTRGGRLSRQRVAEIVRDAAEEASERLSARGLPPLPHTTPHTLRRTYISIALLANRFDVLWVMGQVGHADSKMTMDVYAQLHQRVKREHGMAFDRLVDEAREQLYGTEPPAPTGRRAGGLGHGIGHEPAERANSGTHESGSEPEKPPHLQEDPGMARPGLEPGTPRFSALPPRRSSSCHLQAIPPILAVAIVSRFSRNVRPFLGRYGRRAPSSAFSRRHRPHRRTNERQPLAEDVVEPPPAVPVRSCRTGLRRAGVGAGSAGLSPVPHTTPHNAPAAVFRSCGPTVRPLGGRYGRTAGVVGLLVDDRAAHRPAPAGANRGAGGAVAARSPKRPSRCRVAVRRPDADDAAGVPSRCNRSRAPALPRWRPLP